MLKKAMLLLVCSLLIAALPAGYAYAETESGASATEQRLEAAAEGGALAGWQCYSCGEDGERRAAPGCLSVAEGYGGDIQLSMGVRMDGTLNGISILSISETAGLGMNANTDAFKGQFADKNVEQFTYTKNGASADNEIDAISGATITTNAVTNGVNGGLLTFQYLKGGN